MKAMLFDSAGSELKNKGSGGRILPTFWQKKDEPLLLSSHPGFQSLTLEKHYLLLISSVRPQALLISYSLPRYWFRQTVRCLSSSLETLKEAIFKRLKENILVWRRSFSLTPQVDVFYFQLF